MKSRHSHDKLSFKIGKPELTALAETGIGTLVDQVFMVVAGATQSRQLVPGMRLQSVRQLADDCGISRDTAARAYDKLVAHGLIESRRGSGFFAKGGAGRRPPERLPARKSLFYPHGIGDLTRFRLGLLRPDQALVSRSGIGYLPEDWIDEAGLAGALRAVTRGSQRGLTQHGDAQGYLPLRQQLHLKLSDLGIQADASHIILTGGATDALHLVLHAFARTGDFVVFESPCQPILTDRLLSTGLEFEAVTREADGPNIEALRAVCEKHKPKLFICNSVLHNPTGGHLAPHKAFQILKLAEEFDFMIVEDDTYGDLQPINGPTPVARLAPLDQLQRVIYLSSFSKTLAPGLRVGYLAASPERIEWLAAYRALNCIATNSFAERAIYRLLSEGHYRHHCEQLRNRLAAARPQVAEALRARGFHIEIEADAGMFLWANLGAGVDSFAVAQQLLAQGHLIAPGPVFARYREATSMVRFNIAATLGSPILSALPKALGR